jgi:hypothetical protein
MDQVLVLRGRRAGMIDMTDKADQSADTPRDLDRTVMTRHQEEPGLELINPP